MRGPVRFAVLIAAVGLLVSCGRNSSAEFVGTWFDAKGRPLPEQVIRVGLGPKHCGWQSIAFMEVGWPVGSRIQPTRLRSFARDPKGLLSELSSGRLDTDADLPSDATATGFHHGEWELWVVLSEDTSVYLVSSDRVERWPAVGGGCA